MPISLDSSPIRHDTDVSKFFAMSKDKLPEQGVFETRTEDQARESIGTGIGIFILMMIISVLIAAYGYSEVKQATAQGYVEMRGKPSRTSSTFYARYTREKSPVRFHIALFPGVFGSLFFASAGLALFVAGAVNTVQHGQGRAVGTLRVMQWVGWLVMFTSAAAMLVYFIFPLRVYSAPPCRNIVKGYPLCEITNKVIDPN